MHPFSDEAAFNCHADLGRIKLGSKPTKFSNYSKKIITDIAEVWFLSLGANRPLPLVLEEGHLPSLRSRPLKSS